MGLDTAQKREVPGTP
uniref:Uncharacterized protein n=1 Tax=Anguilla anguilla TaxID=7936 RepID=A0A0E9PWA2_ANGAN